MDKIINTSIEDIMDIPLTDRVREEKVVAIIEENLQPITNIELVPEEVIEEEVIKKIEEIKMVETMPETIVEAMPETIVVTMPETIVVTMPETISEDPFEATIKNCRFSFSAGEKVEATVIKVGKNSVFIDVNAPSEGVIDVMEFRDKTGAINITEGDKILAFFVRSRDGFEFTTKMGKENSVGHLQEIYDAKIPVEGKVVSEINGGFKIEVANEDAFCPYSQIDVQRNEPKTYIGNKYQFIITELNNRNIVVSRRKILAEEVALKTRNLQENLVEGEFIDGVVTKIATFGVFVDVGGLQGLIPMSELAWFRVEDANEIVQVNQKVNVKIIKLDWVSERISLSLKQAAKSPWASVEQKYELDNRYTGKITRLMNFGAFVELEKGIEGLVHISKLGAGRRINHPKEVVKVGDEVECFIESVDVENQKISLSMEDTYNEKINFNSEESTPAINFEEGDKVLGKIENIKDFGVFVRLSPSQSGLLHVSATPAKDDANKFRALSKLYILGNEIEVIVNRVDNGKISLVLEGENSDDAEVTEVINAQQNQANNFGNMGSIFDKLSF